MVNGDRATKSVMHLWSYEDMNHRSEVKAKLAANEAWKNEYLTKTGPLIIRQDNRLMTATKPLVAPDSEGNIYEYRYYRCKVGKTKVFAEAITKAMSVRERHSKMFAFGSQTPGNLMRFRTCGLIRT